MIMKRQIESRKQLLWGIIAIVLGLIIIIYSGKIIDFSIQLLGIALSVVGAVEIISDIIKNQKTKEPFGFALFGAIVALIIGIVLFVNPEVLKGLFMVLLGTGVILVACMRIINLVNLRKAGAKFHVSFFLFPILFALSGATMIFFPAESSSWIVKFAGIWIIAFGISEIVGKVCIKIPEANTEE